MRAYAMRSLVFVVLRKLLDGLYSVVIRRPHITVLVELKSGISVHVKQVSMFQT